MGLIYLLTSPSGKQYVGQTINTFQNRWKGHMQSIGKDKGCPMLSSALKKYGHENFKKEILIEVDDEELNNYEMHYIEEFNTLCPNGYNLTAGGSKGKLADIVKDKIRQSILATMESNPRYKKQLQSNFKKNDPELPRYVSKKLNRKGELLGYRVFGHPNCPKMKYFCSAYGDLENRYKETIKYLDYLNSLEQPLTKQKKSDRPERNLPKYVIEVKNKKNVVYGYQVAIEITKLKFHVRNRFLSKDLTLEEKLRLAVNYVNEQMNEVQRLKDNGFVF